jgi:hypothetical protein
VKITREVLLGTQFDFCGSPTATSVMGGFEVFHMGMFFENAVNDLAERSNPLAVDDADVVDSLAAALTQIFRHQILYVLRAERMQVQHPINRDPDRVIFRHLFIQTLIYVTGSIGSRNGNR